MTRLLLVGAAVLRIFDSENIPFHLCYFNMRTGCFESVSANSFRNRYLHKSGKTLIEMSWWADGTKDGGTFCVGIPGRFHKIESE